jgi:hypothetical protein
MNLDNKLSGIPAIYYINYDHHANRNEHMDRNLSNLKVNEYHRVSASKYTENNLDEWKHLLLDIENYKLSFNTAGYSIICIQLLQNWLETTDDPYLIITKDTIDFGIIPYWHFDWNYLMENIPYDWDCIQMGFENIQCIPFYLHPIMPAHTFGPSLINRHYAKKIVKLHHFDGQYKLTNYIANMNFGGHSGTVDYFVGHNGKTYSLPLFPNSLEFFAKQTKKYDFVHATRLAYYDWWKCEKIKFSLDEFFNYGKPNDLAMIKKTSNYIPQYGFKK